MKKILIFKSVFILFFLFVFLSGCSNSGTNLSGTPETDGLSEEPKDELLEEPKETENPLNEIEDTDSLSEEPKDELLEEPKGDDELSKIVEEDMDRETNKMVLEEITDNIENGEAEGLKEESERESDELSKKLEEVIDEEENKEVMKEVTGDIETTDPNGLVEEPKDNIDEEKKETMKSCNAITDSSTCIDYLGSFWTEDQKINHCNETGILSPNSCESGNIGGCRVGGGTANDMIMWMYPYGGAPISLDSAGTAKMGCNMSPMSSWQDAK